MIVIAVTVLEWLITKLPNPPVPPIAKQIAETVILILAIVSVVEILIGAGGIPRID